MLNWNPGPGADRARRDGFTLDRTLISRRHAVVSIENSRNFRVASLNEKLPTLLLKANANEYIRVQRENTFHPGDMLIIGMYLISISSLM